MPQLAQFGSLPSAIVSRPSTQTIGLTAGRLVASIISLGWTAVVARELTESQVGALSLAMSLAVALSILPDLGLPMVVSDRVSRHPDEARSLVAHVVRIRLIVSVFTALLIVAMYRMGSRETLAVPLLLAVSVGATAVHSTATAALRGLGVVLPDAVNEVASRAFVLGVGTALLTQGFGVIGAAAVLAVADLCSAVALAVLVERRTQHGTAFPRHIVSWRATAPLAGSLLIASLHTRIDVWLLAVISGTSDVAHYALPARLAEGLLLPAGVASALVLPLTGQIADPSRRARSALRYVGVVSAMVAAGSLVVGVFAEPILRVAFGNNYSGDSKVLRLLCIASLPAAIAVGLAPMVAILVRRSFFALMTVALVVNVVANVILVPRHAEVGSAIASIVSTTVLAAGLVWVLMRLSPVSGTSADRASATPA